MTSGCCGPTIDAGVVTSAPSRVARASHAVHQQLLSIPGGLAQRGTDRPLIPQDGEGPMQALLIPPFRMSSTVITTREFAHFAEQSGYRTDAERRGWSFVFASHHRAAPEDVSVIDLPWWYRVFGANWTCPYGRGIKADDEDPVVHVSCADAEAFCGWHGLRLPSEVEWEHAARGGLMDPIYPWGDRAPDDDNFQPCNIWQGQFPTNDLGLDGYRGLAPANSFPANGFGLHNMSGNVWEWTAGMQESNRILKGGSHLCHASYCHRFRIAARMANPPHMTTSHIGFRVVGDSD
ncbi:formylglycine-generating enzyme family protein [Falsirhodobacter sp. 20TX0035]|uniref:formylglycine-generating enzyme family protein n=1 Tax=Falsirhodobacter sp. 20TX0035 TaxID=3022019 RepID=UPI00232B7D47|nr:formylglycine-generating enzyme family protein [Falsirhodobacter sp. 20TX0035]MDB6454164.1 formylglycine-generating enzyme family protein [Falsirhodobacter sp. 20TX0035]